MELGLDIRSIQFQSRRGIEFLRKVVIWMIVIRLIDIYRIEDGLGNSIDVHTVDDTVEVFESRHKAYEWLKDHKLLEESVLMAGNTDYVTMHTGIDQIHWDDTKYVITKYSTQDHGKEFWHDVVVSISAVALNT